MLCGLQLGNAVFNRFCFLQSCQVHGRWYGGCSHAPRPQPASPTPLHSGPFVTNDETALTHPRHPKAALDIRLVLGAVRSLGLGKCLMARVHRDRIEQNRFAALKILCAPPAHPTPWKPLTFLSSP